MIDISRYIALLKSMLAVPAVSRNEYSRATLLEKWIKAEGLNVNRSNNNLIISGGGDPEKAPILLNTHIDTVPPHNEWESNPFKPIPEKDRITALGSNDAGASVIALLATYIELSKQRMEDKIVLVLSAEEEVSGRNGLESVLPMLPALKFGIVGEPTSLQPAVAERGLMVVDATSKGESGHAARREGVNAIYKAMKDIDALAGLVFDDKSHWLDDPSVQITMINSGSVHNVVPAICKFVVDVRSNDLYTNFKLLEMMQQVCDAELKPRSMRLGSSCIDNKHPVWEILSLMDMQPYGSPTLSDMALLDFPAIKLGPGESSRSHTAGEHIYINEIEEAVERYTSLIKALQKADL